MASFKKIPNGTYQATIYCGRDANGKQIRKYVTRQTLKECKVAVREIEMKYKEGLMTNPETVRLSSWMDEWIELNRNRLSPSTIQSYKIYIEHHFKPFFGNIKIDQINEIHIKRYMSEKLKILSMCTIRKHIFVLSRMLREILKDNNPIKHIELPKKEHYVPHIVSDSEFKNIHNIFKGHKYESIILLAAWCGLRRGEIFALKWDDVDSKRNIIKIDESRCITEESKYIIKTTKSHNGIREVALPKQLIEMIEKIRKNQKEINTLVFPGRPDNFTHRFKQMQEMAGLNPIRFHDLRHYHASWLYKNGIPDLYAAQRLGHDIQTLKSIYQHLDSTLQKDIDANIINLIESDGKKG